MIYVALIACEVGFWVVLLAGLATRYVLRRPRAGAVLLACTPLVDLALLLFALIDLRHGGTATIAHGLAAVYIGVSVAWGHRMVRWADERFAYRFVGGPPPSRPPKYGPEHARRARRDWYRDLLAWVIGCALLLGGAAALGGVTVLASLLRGEFAGVGATESFGALLGLAGMWTLVLVIDFAWSFSYTLWPRNPRSEPSTP